MQRCILVLTMQLPLTFSVESHFLMIPVKRIYSTHRHVQSDCIWSLTGGVIKCNLHPTVNCLFRYSGVTTVHFASNRFFNFMSFPLTPHTQDALFWISYKFSQFDRFSFNAVTSWLFFLFERMAFNAEVRC